MSAPVFPLVGGQVASAPVGAVTLALTIDADPDNLVPGDLHLLNGQVHFWDGAQAYYQKLVVLLKFFKGEWFLNTEEGIPYFQSILVHNPSTRVILGILKKALLAAPGAATVPVLSLVRDTASRTATVTFQVVFDSGIVINSSDFQPFILQVPAQ